MVMAQQQKNAERNGEQSEFSIKTLFEIENRFLSQSQPSHSFNL